MQGDVAQATLAAVRDVRHAIDVRGLLTVLGDDEEVALLFRPPACGRLAGTARAHGSSNEVMDSTSNGRSVCACAPAVIKMLKMISPFAKSRLAI